MLALLMLAAGLLVGAQQPEHLAQIQVHGNLLTPDAEIIRLAGVEIGMPIEATTFEVAASRLRASKKFEDVEVLRRFASISDTTQISMIITVDEGPVTLQGDGTVKAGADQPPNVLTVRKRTGWSAMFMPILKFEDGYGLSYGVRAAIPDAAGKRSRLSFPATWGGEKRAAAEFDKEVASIVVHRVQAGAGFARRTNPFFEERDDRARIWIRGERALARPLRIGATGEWQHVSFGGDPDRVFSTGVDITFDTRIDPIISRNAVYARASWDHLTFANANPANRSDVDLRGYVGLVGQMVLIVRGQWAGASAPLPPYLQPLLGGSDSLRGFKAGSFVGDTLVGASADLRVPISSPLSVGKVGFSMFLDTAAAYDKGEHVRDQKFQRGVGGGVWFSAAFIRFDVYVAHGLGRSTRAHFTTSVLF